MNEISGIRDDGMGNYNLKATRLMFFFFSYANSNRLLNFKVCLFLVSFSLFLHLSFQFCKMRIKCISKNRFWIDSNRKRILYTLWSLAGNNRYGMFVAMLVVSKRMPIWTRWNVELIDSNPFSFKIVDCSLSDNHQHQIGGKCGSDRCNALHCANPSA